MQTNIYQFVQEAIYRYPDNVAIADEKEEITYRELEVRIRNVTAYLSKYLCLGDKVAVCTERNVFTIVLLLSLIRLGVTYIPLESTPPINLVKDICDIADPKYVISKSYINLDMIDTIPFDELRRESLKGSRIISNIPTLDCDLHRSIYIIFTSGSTGKPKGVIIEHGNLINLVQSLKKRIYDIRYSIDQHVRIGVMASFSFDASVKQIFMALCFGNTLVICPQRIKALGRLAVNYLISKQVSVIDATPSLLEILLKDSKARPYKDLELLLVGGEILRGKHIGLAKTIFGDNVTIVNLYGPTECCVDVSYYMVPNDYSVDNEEAILPIGYPLDNIKLLLDSTDTSNAGELIVEGVCVGRGYAGNIADNSFDIGACGQRRYRTGDHCILSPDGKYYVTGRIDNQIKLRGYRVELDAIDSAIMALEKTDFSLSLHISKNSRDYICTAVKSQLPIERIIEVLKETLPTYMIPTIVVAVEAIEINEHGKIDKNYYREVFLQKLK